MTGLYWLVLRDFGALMIGLTTRERAGRNFRDRMAIGIV